MAPAGVWEAISDSYLGFKVSREREIKADCADLELSPFGSLDFTHNNREPLGCLQRGAREKASLARHLIGVHRLDWQIG